MLDVALSCFGTSHTANRFGLIGSVEGTEISVLREMHCQSCLGKLGDFNDRSPPYIVGKTKTDQIKPSEI